MQIIVFNFLENNCAVNKKVYRNETEINYKLQIKWV